MNKNNRRLSAILLMIVTFFVIGCSASPGKKAAKEVIRYVRSGNMDSAQESLGYYSHTLSGQDAIDFVDELERAGIM